MPTHFRWLWYLVGLAGMVLSVIGILAILGSAADLGILVPLVVGGAIAIGYAIIRFRRSIDAALAAAPSRQAGATPPIAADPKATSTSTSSTPAPTTASATPASASQPAGPASPGVGPKKPPSGPPRTSRR